MFEMRNSELSPTSSWQQLMNVDCRNTSRTAAGIGVA
jgi:hypothetical protein